MSNHNNTQYSKKNEAETEVTQNNVYVEPTVTVVEETTNTAEVKIDTAIEETATTTTPEVQPEPESETESETVIGTVFGCSKLNVRATPDLFAEVVCIVSAGDEVIIDPDKSYNDWLCVCTATGIDGYCMRKYVNASL